MKRNSKQDWTQVLQERLQDAELAAPSFADLIGESPDSIQKSPAMAGQPLPNTGRRPGKGGYFGMSSPWPWALAGAAAIAAALLLFRPAPSGPADPTSPDPAPLIAQGTPSAAPSSPSVPAPASPVAQGVPSSVAGTPASVPGTPASVPSLPSSVPGHPSSSAGTPSSFAGLTGEPPTPAEAPAGGDQPASEAAPSPKKAMGAETFPDPSAPSADPVEVAGNTPFTDWTGEAPAAHRKPRLALRVHAATAGMSAKSGGTGFRTFSWAEKQYVSTNAALSLNFSSDAPNAVNGTNQPMIVTYKEETYRFIPVERVPTFPVSFGVSAELDMTRHWALTLGLDYTQRAGYWLRDDVPQSLALHYLGLPLEAHYLLWPESRFRLYLGVGLKAEKCILATGGEPLRDPFLFSWNLQGGADYRLLPGVRIYLAPVFSQYFNRSSYVNTWDNRFQLQLRVGLSFDLK